MHVLQASKMNSCTPFVVYICIKLNFINLIGNLPKFYANGQIPFNINEDTERNAMKIF